MIFQPLQGKHPDVMFGYYLEDYGRSSPFQWLLNNKERFVMPIEAIAADRRAYDHEETPCDSGVYFLFLSDALQYVGRSRDISGRLLQHRHPGGSPIPADWFDSWAAIWVPDELSKFVECYYIHKLKPPRNVHYPTLWQPTRALLG